MHVQANVAFQYYDEPVAKLRESFPRCGRSACNAILARRQTDLLASYSEAFGRKNSFCHGAALRQDRMRMHDIPGLCVLEGMEVSGGKENNILL